MKDSYCITLKVDARPFQVSVPRKVPFPLVSEELDRMLEAGVISRVERKFGLSTELIIP